MSEIKELAIGAAKLDKNQMEAILPGYQNIYRQIYQMRGFAKQYRQYRQSKNKLMDEIATNNVFAILGNRGAGKSSVLLTLKQDIRDKDKVEVDSDNNYPSKNNQDIVLQIVYPTILPETMGNRGDMIGWLLGMFKETVEEISKVAAEQLEDGECGENGSFMNCKGRIKQTAIYKKYEELLRKYRYTREEYADILKENYEGLNEYIDKTQKILDPENKLKKCFFEFINEMVKVKIKAVGNNEEDENKQPMIFVFLDDVDLSKNRCEELLELIIRYLCHPNIITFISGDYQVFENEQFMSYMRNGQLMELITHPNEENILGQRLLRENQYLASDTLKKIMPPAYRYKLRKLPPKERLDFHYGEGRETLRALLEAKFKNLCDDEKTIKVINAYGLFLDDTPRGIMNVYCALKNMQENSILKEKNSLKEDEYIRQVRILMDTIIRSSSILSQYEDKINACIQINKPFTETFFNPERLKKEIKKNNDKYRVTKEESNITVIHDTIVTFAFAHFVESLVQLVDPNRKIHGDEQLWELLEFSEKSREKNDQAKHESDKLPNTFKIYPRSKHLNVILDLYEAMLSNDALNIMPTMENQYLKDFSLQFYFKKLDEIEEVSREHIVDNISDLANDDSEWLKEKFRIIYYHRSPLCMMFNKAINKVKEKSCTANDKQGTWKYEKIIKKEFGKKFCEDVDFNIEGDSALKTSKAKEYLVNKMKLMLSIEIEELEDGNPDQEGSNGYIKKRYEKLQSKEEIKAIIAEVEKEKADKEEQKKVLLDKVKDFVKDYFSKLQMVSSNGQAGNGRKQDVKGQPNEEEGSILLSIIYYAFAEIEKVSGYETDYFDYFDNWHQVLKNKTPYKEWCEDECKSDKSPLTLVLENKECIKHR